jgi:translocation and assembly module TamB
VVGGATVNLENFPLDVVPQLVDRQIKGRITGRASLRDWGKQARLDAHVVGRGLTFGTATMPSLELRAGNPGERLTFKLAVATSKGTAEASLDAEAHWGARALPTLKRRGQARLVARDFELMTLTPLLSSYVSEVSGVLDADAQVQVDGDSTRVSGTARLEHGVVQVPMIGQRFSDISAQVAVGDNQFKLRQLSARGLTGKLSASGAARLDGFELRGAEAKLDIKQREMLPLTIEGATLGEVWGSVNLAYDAPARGPRTLDVKVQQLHLITPETEGHGLQSLENSEQIRIGTRRSDGRFVLLPVQPLEASDDTGNEAVSKPAQPLRIRVDLGNKLTVARGRTAQATLGGQLLIVSDGETDVQGRIEVRGGKLDVQGKTFDIERGVVTFDGADPSNPTITATARWDGPDYTIYADYVGDVENGRIKLRAEPPLTQDQIASLLLFGDPDGASGSSSDPNSASLAVTVAGDTAAKGLNQVLGDFTKLDVRARIDTTEGNARPELLWQVSPRVVAKVTRAIGEPAVGDSPDRTFLTLELKLRRAWALSAVFGDHGGSALDLIWRHRY